MYVCMYVCIHVYMYVCTYVHMYVCVYIYCMYSLSTYACSYAVDAKELHEFSARMEPLAGVLRGGLQPTHKTGECDCETH